MEALQNVIIEEFIQRFAANHDDEGKDTNNRERERENMWLTMSVTLAADTSRGRCASKSSHSRWRKRVFRRTRSSVAGIVSTAKEISILSIATDELEGIRDCDDCCAIVYRRR